MARRKEELELRNARGELADTAARELAKKPDHKQKKILAEGRMPQGWLHGTARRKAVKLFLSHYHEVGRALLGLPQVRPWALEHGGHAHYISPQEMGW